MSKKLSVKVDAGHGVIRFTVDGHTYHAAYYAALGKLEVYAPGQSPITAVGAGVKVEETE